MKPGEKEVTYATGAFVIQVLLPLRMKPPSASSAVVSIPAGSDPWFGSVSPLRRQLDRSEKRKHLDTPETYEAADEFSTSCET